MDVREKLIEILRKPIFPHELVDPIEAVADYLLDSGVTVQEWVPVDERLPEENQEVILQDFYGNITIGKMKITDGIEGFSDGDWWASANNYVAWQPLPEPYKECD